MVDIDEQVRPDLVMRADIRVLPDRYANQFDVVVFEGIAGAPNGNGEPNYERVQAFLNAYTLLRNGGTFLIDADNDQEQQPILEGSGFIGIIFFEDIQESIYGQYVHGANPFGPYFVATKPAAENEA